MNYRSSKSYANQAKISFLQLIDRQGPEPGPEL